VSRGTELVHVGILTRCGFSRSGPPQSILGLHLGNVSRDVPVGKNPTKVSTLNQFMNAGGNYPATDFWRLGWVSVRLQTTVVEQPYMYVLEVFADDLMRLGLYEAIKATCFGNNISIPTFYAILEMYYPVLGHSLHQSANWRCAPRDVGSIKLPNGFLTIGGVFSVCRRASTAGEEGTDPLRDISRAHVSFLHMSRLSFWLRS